VNLAFHDAESASAGFFRVGARHDSSGAPVGAVPLTPLSLPILRLGAFAWSDSSWLPRPLPSPLREEETISTARGDFHRRESEGCPSGVACIATGDTPRACVERCRSRARSRDAFAMIRPLGVLSPSAPKALACADALGYRGLDPRPRPSSRLALFTRSADWRFSGSDCRPTTSATYVRRTVTLPSIRFSRFGAPRFRVRPNLRSFSPCPFGA